MEFPEQFIPLFKSIIDKYDLYTASIFGIIYLYSNMSNGYCSLSQNTIANKLKISRSTVIRNIGILVKDKVILDITDHDYNIKGQTRKYKENLKFLIDSGFQKNSVSD